MKKILILLTSLLAVSSALCFTGCNDIGNTDAAKDKVSTKISAVEDDGNDDTCPDCEERGMPKVRFDFKDGRPASKGDGNEGVEPHHEWHRKKRPHSPKKPSPTPPEDGGQDKNEN
ncbi:MAG: thioredoxin [Clostridia bacterium]|nr:thioredoxin [Clostridia bacterium]